MSELRVTDTNSASDARGRAFGLEGNDALYIVGAVVGALGLYLVLYALLRLSMGVALFFALPILLGPLAWVLLLRHHKPDGYAEDLFDDLVNGEGWSLAPRAQPFRPGDNAHE